MALALLTQWIHDSRDADFTVVTKQQRRFIPVGVNRLQFEEISCYSLAMLHVVTATAPPELLCGCVLSTFVCTLTSGHFAFGACPRNLVCKSGSRQSVNECSFFVNLLHYGMYLLESLECVYWSCKIHANLFENVPFAPRLNRTIPPVIFELLLAMCQR